MNMDFFGHQAAARRATKRLVVLFALAVICIVAAIYLAAAAIFGVADARASMWQPELLLAVAAVTLAVVGLASAYKTARLRQGGPLVAAMLGGRWIDPGSADAQERVLSNVVEEMAIASGVPLPMVFVLDGETGVNAFAAGWGTADAAVAVTRGCLQSLDRDELQGVIAHEFSHVFHGDMRLNIRLMGVLFGIVCIATVGEIIVRSIGRVRVGGSGKGKGGAAGIVLFGVALLAIGWIGVMFANLIKAAVSRQREFLADASAVAYTRNPRGIGMALARIGGLGSRLQNAHAREASHFFFADGVTRWFGTLGATHPPLEQRVERVLPGFLKELRAGGSMPQAAARTPTPAIAGFAGAAVTVAADSVSARVGAPQAEHVDSARALLAGLPLDVLGAARDPQRAPALLLALLLDCDDQAQKAILGRCEPARAHDARALALELKRLDPTVRLPLVEVMVPALRRLPAAAIVTLHQQAQTLAEADGVLAPFEFALLKIVRKYVPLPGTPPRRQTGRPLPLTALPAEIGLVLSVLARASSDGEAAAAAAFTAGAATLLGLPPQQLRPAAACPLTELDQALEQLARLSPLGKKALLNACAATAAADGVIAAEEGELLRALAEHWDCPLPPLWSTPAA